VREKWVPDLQGLSLPKVAIRLKTGSKAKCFLGEMVFTEDGIGGPAVFDVSRSAAELLNHQKTVPITMDFLPDVKPEELAAMLIERCAAHPKKEIAGILSEWFPKRLSVFLQTYACGTQPVLACAFQKSQRQKLVEAVKATPLTLIRSGPLEKATVTRGGVSRKEIDSKTMRSRLCEGLFFAGEVMDVDGPCGGYNLQIAFSTGVLAGRSAADSLCLL
jgi:predicted Rossmann fold flavoprotein